MVPSTTCYQELVERFDVVDRLRGRQRFAVDVIVPNDRKQPRQ